MSVFGRVVAGASVAEPKLVLADCDLKGSLQRHEEAGKLVPVHPHGTIKRMVRLRESDDGESPQPNDATKAISVPCNFPDFRRTIDPHAASPPNDCHAVRIAGKQAPRNRRRITQRYGLWSRSVPFRTLHSRECPKTGPKFPRP